MRWASIPKTAAEAMVASMAKFLLALHPVHSTFPPFCQIKVK
jgi:hypothetical protein